ncbi:hypothetical protein [Paraburkholderia sp. SUR17]|uniref:hypothetical protein n=1 Tax=Paraburkholderia sp. SUR17 TaxID=3034358 RepID=UPI002407F0B7|nr:hypothetical protein [Paraburkholderia sp. SUR17]WEY37686.1 hypothetical protein P2869_11405 [Paraburkholderia sp. SUR17]
MRTALTFLGCALALAVLPVSEARADLTARDDVNSSLNTPALTPGPPLGSEYPTHGNRQAGELPLNPADPRAQLVNGLPNNAQSGGYGSPLAGVHPIDRQ